MKILIVVGFVIPEAAELVGEQKLSCGGWVTGLINGLKSIPELNIAVAMKSSQKIITVKIKDDIEYYFLPTHKNNSLDVYNNDCLKVLHDFNPHLIHAEGAEVFITNRFFNLYKGSKILSIKGIFSDIQKYEDGNITTQNLKFVFYKIILIYKKYLRFRKRKKLEKESYLLADYVLGRTLYDKAHSLNFNKSLAYFHVNESLRSEFYNNNWSYEGCNKYSIFVGNGNIARKGAHIAVKALKLLINDFPTAKLYIVGSKQNSLKDKLLFKGYLNFLIKKNHLENNVVQLGSLNENEMIEVMLKCQVYLLPSFVENSSNTLGEAMLMGMPCIVSYCGGVSSLAKDEEDALFYRPEDEIILAYQIGRMFRNEIDFLELGSNAKIKAKSIYDHNRNTNELVSIYKKIFNNEIHKYNY